ncbi:hypothetical protein KEF85_10500 [Methylomonas paludis]|uniref:Uncharacterized protein n=1 Tax=Methylomonas paludis TaxID=1173101 RepID=A0A975R927_9GAMM|nr:hypothetical protein [Methylomonas paludis]QWF69799.1 hypothetical protein KEF85_10500 [Methylomonas paludis]
MVYIKGHDAAIELAEQAELVIEKTGISQITRMELLGQSEAKPKFMPIIVTTFKLQKIRP